MGVWGWFGEGPLAANNDYVFTYMHHYISFSLGRKDSHHIHFLANQLRPPRRLNNLPKVVELLGYGSQNLNPVAFRNLMLSRFSRVLLCVTLWTVAHQAPLSMGFSRQEYQWIAMPSSWESSQPRDRTRVSHLLQWQADPLPLVPPYLTIMLLGLDITLPFQKCYFEILFVLINS